MVDIYTYADLQAMSADLTADYVLMNDIDATGESDWVPVGSLGTKFTGTFDGGGHVITGLHFTETGYPGSNYWGLFGFIDSSHIYDVGLANVSFATEWGRQVGGISGSASAVSVIERCYVTGTISNYTVAGGILASGDTNTIITDCYTDVDITIADDFVGGIIGIIGGGVIIDYGYI